MYKLCCLAFLVFVSGLAVADTLSEKWAKRLESAEASYQTALQKADNVRFYAVQKATQERTKVLKSALADATKAGDFDAATEIKDRLSATALAEAIVEVEWLSPGTWGRFMLKPDGTLIAEGFKDRTRWTAIDEDSILVVRYFNNVIGVDRLIFSKDRTKVTAYVVGTQQSAAWEASRKPAQK